MEGPKTPITEITVLDAMDFGSTLPGEEFLVKAVEALDNIPDFSLNDCASVTTGATNKYAKGGVVHGHGSVFYGEGTCHGFMSRAQKSYADQPDPVVSFSRWNHRPEEVFHESQRAWFDFITGEKSPWRSVIPNKDVLVKGENINSREYMWKRGFVFWNVDKLPSNAQQSFLIASRQAAQHPHFVLQWHRWVKDGMHPAFAMIFLSQWYDKDVMNYFGAYSTFARRKAHRLAESDMSEFPLSVQGATEEYVHNFCHGRMVEKKMNVPYKQNMMYTPVNTIWHKINENGYYKGQTYIPPQTGFETYGKYLEKTYPKPVRRKNSEFGKSPESVLNHPAYTMKDVMEIAEKEQEKIFGKEDRASVG